jgi:hypothetical protein
MLCVTDRMVPHFYVWPVAPRNDYIDEDLPDEDEPDATARAPQIPSHTSPVANKSHALPQTRKFMAGWDICHMMCLAGGSGLEQAISDADAAMPLEGFPVASERAGGESRRTGLKRKAGEITRSAAEDFALLTTRTASALYAADFLSTVRNVSFSDKDLKLSKCTLNNLKLPEK